MTLKERATKLKTDIPAVFIAMKKKETPLLIKLLAGITIVYALSPVDLIPDFIPVLGLLDDVILLPALIVLIIKLMPKDIFEQCRTESAGLWVLGKPKQWYCALPIVAVWALLIVSIIKLFL